MSKCLRRAHVGLQQPGSEVHDLAPVSDARACHRVMDEIGFDGPTCVDPFNAEVRALPPKSVWP